MTIGFFADRTGINAAKKEFVTSLLWKGALAFALVLPVMLVLVHYATRQLLLLADAMKRIADGALDTVVPYTKRSDEVGVMARTVEVFQANAFETRRLEAEQEAAEARVADTRKSEMIKLADSFEAAIGEVIENVASASTELEAAASTLTHTAEGTLQLSGQRATASQEASMNVQSVASATEELSASVHEIARQVDRVERHRQRSSGAGRADGRTDHSPLGGGGPYRRCGATDHRHCRADQSPRP